MKLSDAILIGRTLRPQTTGEFFKIDVRRDDVTSYRSCALGAAAEAVAGAKALETDPDGVLEILKREFPELSKEQLACPVCGLTGLLSTTIINLNDDHDWTREQIARWLSGLGF